ncbi:sensor histidine kinase [Rhizobium mesoamericanum]|uniref:sensor histidine kinase n=1 Tax=Rhizobium mesoamericanum TaxID=1079800 RepID=UPI0003FF253E|nr:sensor histidine kinase [Rhizobium mesoamericanum]
MRFYQPRWLVAGLFARLRHSLRAQLLAWVTVTLVCVLCLNLYVSQRRAVFTANIVTDNMLLGSARMIAEAVRVDPGGTITVDIPPAALEIFGTGYGDRVYYRVTTPWGNLVAGDPALVQPEKLATGQDIRFRDMDIRAMSINHPVVGLGNDGVATVTVAVTLNSEAALRRSLWMSDLTNQVVLVVAAGLVTVLGLRRLLGPVLRLRDAVLASRRERLEPFDPASVQTELQPLVHALNDYMGRVQKQMGAQRRFVANAAHQLRTPLTLLATQAGVAARETNATRRHEALQALTHSTRQVSRLAEQLLTLTRAEPGSRAPRAERIDMAEVARKVLEAHAEEALRRGIDIGLEADGQAPVVGDGTMLREMVVNLVDNALRYTPAPGEITVSVAHDKTHVVLTVDDSGPGIPENERNQVFERFYRIIGTRAEGSGLGLAIVHEVVDGAGGSIDLGTSPSGGLAVTVRLPLAS